ncbi:MAG: nucleotidyltransferase domain-containing protein [Lachnospiraceae bacterium]|nr:nucleotidyltransferase domain-containing protein [Lachnospiraceae bacterium]
MPVSIKEIVTDFANDMEDIFQKDLSRGVVYGSYARGDYTENSDVDVMVLVARSLFENS